MQCHSRTSMLYSTRDQKHSDYSGSNVNLISDVHPQHSTLTAAAFFFSCKVQCKTNHFISTDLFIKDVNYAFCLLCVIITLFLCIRSDVDTLTINCLKNTWNVICAVRLFCGLVWFLLIFGVTEPQWVRGRGVNPIGCGGPDRVCIRVCCVSSSTAESNGSNYLSVEAQTFLLNDFWGSSVFKCYMIIRFFKCIM